MNSSTQLADDTSRTLTLDALPVQFGREVLAAPIRFVGFWAAVSLPFLYVPLLFNGLESAEVLVFAGLVLLNAVALVVGHEYKQ